jgi:DNA repair ATPase RecN
VEEVARMLGGEAITPATLAHAREMFAHMMDSN